MVRMAATIWFSVREEIEEADGDERGAHQEQAQIAREPGRQLGIAEGEDENGQQGRQAEQDGQEDQGGEVLAQDDLADRERRRVEELVGARLLLLGQQPHGQERDDEDEDDAHVVEQGREDHLVDVDLLGVVGVLGHLHGLGVEPHDQAVEEVADEQQEAEHHGVGDRRAEVRPDLLFDEGPDVASLFAPSGDDLEVEVLDAGEGPHLAEAEAPLDGLAGDVVAEVAAAAPFDRAARSLRPRPARRRGGPGRGPPRPPRPGAA